MLVRKCDRCKKEIYGLWYTIYVNKNTVNQENARYSMELCGTCKQNIDIYLEKEDQI